MAKQGGQAGTEDGHGAESTQNIQSDIDALFQLPLAEFTPARNALAARLKKSALKKEADRVKALAKPPISAWAVNQLYWKHRESFDQLIDAGQRFLQASKTAGRNEIAESGNARQKVLSDLARLTASLLLEAGHSATPELMRRINATLEAISVYASFADSSPGCLTHDLDPPGFDALVGLTPQKRVAAQTSTPKPADVAQRTKIVLAEASLSDAERGLDEARMKARAAESSLKRAVANARDADNERREAEERLKRAVASVGRSGAARAGRGGRSGKCGESRGRCRTRAQKGVSRVAVVSSRNQVARKRKIPSLQRRGCRAESAAGVVAHADKFRCERPPGAAFLEAAPYRACASRHCCFSSAASPATLRILRQPSNIAGRFHYSSHTDSERLARASPAAAG